MYLFKTCLLTIIGNDIDYGKLPLVLQYYLKEIDNNIRNCGHKCSFHYNWSANYSYELNGRRCIMRSAILRKLLYDLLKNNLTKLNNFSTYKIYYGIRDGEYHMTLYMNKKKIEKVSYPKTKICGNEYIQNKNITDIIVNMLQTQ